MDAVKKYEFCIEKSLEISLKALFVFKWTKGSLQMLNNLYESGEVTIKLNRNLIKLITIKVGIR